MILKKILSKEDARSMRVLKNVGGSFVIKGISILINLALIPITIDYLNPTKYGVWLTISSMMAWIYFFDIGLGHGLRNKLSEAMARNEIDKAKAYVSTAYISIACLSSFVFLLFFIVNYFIDWNKLLNVPVDANDNLKSIALIVFSMFSIQFVLQLINSIFYSNQTSAKVSLNNMLSNLFVLASILILIKLTNGSLLYIAIIFSIIPVIVLLTVNIYHFKTRFKAFAPSFKSFDFSVLKDVLNIGLKFFFIQISIMVFFEFSNLLISRFFGPAEVTPYNIAYRYFGMISMVFGILIAPYWSASTEAYVKNDIPWIRKSIRRMYITWLWVAGLGIIMLVFADFVYLLWIKGKVKIDFKISLFLMLYNISICFANIHIVILNGIGKINIQMIFNLIAMVFFIPISYYLAKYLNLGVVGIVLSSIICSLYGIVVAPFEIKKLLQKIEKK